MKTAKYRLLSGEDLVVEYDENAPCRICGLPVGEASMGGTDVCPCCDCGYYRDGESWSFRDATEPGRVRRIAKEKMELWQMRVKAIEEKGQLGLVEEECDDRQA